jgi:hypothetical protein
VVLVAMTPAIFVVLDDVDDIQQLIVGQIRCDFKQDWLGLRLSVVFVFEGFAAAA